MKFDRLDFYFENYGLDAILFINPINIRVSENANSSVIWREERTELC